MVNLIPDNKMVGMVLLLFVLYRRAYPA